MVSARRTGNPPVDPMVDGMSDRKSDSMLKPPAEATTEAEAKPFANPKAGPKLGAPILVAGKVRPVTTLMGQHKLAQALQDNATLSHLLQRVQASSGRLNDVSHLLPPGLKAAVQAGPLDEQSWILTVANAAAAAKLRQMVPQLQQALAQQGWPALEIKLRVVRRS